MLGEKRQEPPGRPHPINLVDDSDDRPAGALHPFERRLVFLQPAVPSLRKTLRSASETACVAVRFMTRLSARLAFECRPGVSTSTICTPGRLTMPRMRWRVVCGLAVTMLTFCATSALTRVDLPTFGRPAIATKPER